MSKVLAPLLRMCVCVHVCMCVCFGGWRTLRYSAAVVLTHVAHTAGDVISTNNVHTESVSVCCACAAATCATHMCTADERTVKEDARVVVI